MFIIMKSLSMHGWSQKLDYSFMAVAVRVVECETIADDNDQFQRL